MEVADKLLHLPETFPAAYLQIYDPIVPICLKLSRALQYLHLEAMLGSNAPQLDRVSLMVDSFGRRLRKCLAVPADHETLVKDLSAWHKQAVTRARRQRLADFTQEVYQFTQRGDSYLAHKTLQKLRPWQPQPKTQLVKDGYLMAAEEELKLSRNMRKQCSKGMKGCNLRSAACCQRSQPPFFRST